VAVVSNIISQATDMLLTARAENGQVDIKNLIHKNMECGLQFPDWAKTPDECKIHKGTNLKLTNSLTRMLLCRAYVKGEILFLQFLPVQRRMALSD
jgi:hypothetical protein